MAIQSGEDRFMASWRGALVAVLLLFGAYWLISSLPSNGEVVAGVRAAGQLHLASDGRLIYADGGSGGTVADGRVMALDLDRKASTVLLDGLAQPHAADLSPTGVACAVTTGQPDRPTTLRCSNGLLVDLDAYVRQDPGPGGLPRFDQPAQPADVVSDGGDGWFVAEMNTGRVLFVDREGTITVVATVRNLAGLALDAGSLWMALGENGIAGVPVETRDAEITQGQWVGGDLAIAVAPRPHASPLVLVRESNGGRGFVTYQVGFNSPYPRVVDGLESPTGMVLLPDGSLAIAAKGQVILFKPGSLP